MALIQYDRWNAVLDEKCCPRCASLDGEIFPVGEGPMAPAHPHCRCRRARWSARESSNAYVPTSSPPVSSPPASGGPVPFIPVPVVVPRREDEWVPPGDNSERPLHPGAFRPQAFDPSSSAPDAFHANVTPPKAWRPKKGVGQ